MCPGPSPVSPPARRLASRARFAPLTWALARDPTTATTDVGPCRRSPSRISSTRRSGSWNQPFRTTSSGAASGPVFVAVARRMPDRSSARAPSKVIRKPGEAAGYSRT